MNSYLVVIERNQDKIELVSKRFSKMVGYNEEFLYRSQLKVILPQIIDEVHCKYTEAFFKKNEQYQLDKPAMNQWIKLSNNNIRYVSVNVLPYIDSNKQIRILGSIRLQPKMILCE